MEVGISCTAFISSYITEQLEKWEKGEIREPSFQIGANSFTEKEWDKLLKKFDDVMDDVRKAQEEERERLKNKEMQENTLRINA